MTEFVSVPAIVVICYFAGFICKSFKIEKLDSFIPVICGTLGLILGIITFYTIPNFIPADNWADAVAIGITSGLAATGINQIFKQIKSLASSNATSGDK